MRNKTLFKTLFLFLASFVLLSYNDDPPNGRTGAPFDGKCSDCHPDNNPGGFNGTAEILGLPDTIQPNTNYQFQIKATVLAGNPIRAGFQLVVVDKNNINAGNLSAANTDTDTEFWDGREYLDHRSGKYFQGAPVSWHFNWTSPGQVDCNTIKFYYIVNYCNGGGDFGDFSIAFADSVYFAGSNTDTIPPQIICPNSFKACAGDTVHYNLPSISDNCALRDTLPIRLSGLPSDTLFPLGSTEMIFQVTDQSGNKATCAFQVEVDSCPVSVSTTPATLQGLLLQPNPVTASGFTIQGLTEAPLSLELFNLEGKLIATIPVSAWPGPFFLTDIPEGVYGLHVLSIGRRHRWLRLIKVR